MKDKLNVLIIGSGGREHAIVKAVVNSPLAAKIFCAPANGGISQDCQSVDIPVTDLNKILEFCKAEKIDFVICGPEVPLSLGLADLLRKNNIAVYGPNKDGAQLEASKAFSKAFMQRNNIPTAIGKNFTDFESAKSYIESVPFNVVVKASGLAAGKGVIIPESKEEAILAAKDMLLNKSFGESSAEIVVEEKMEGEEASIMLIVSGKNYIMLPPSQDHKRIGEGDKGLNTGGMGAYAPAAVVTKEVEADVRQNIIQPTLNALVAEGIDYRGTLYVGIMITKQGAKVVEYNVRFGDPECQVLMPLIKSDTLEILFDAACGNLDPNKCEIKDEFAATIVMTSKGYPNAYEKGKVISFPDKCPEDAYIIHSGTKKNAEGKIITSGGRVLSVTATGNTLENALKKAYSLVSQISFDGAYYRKDIAHRQLARNKK